MRTKFNDVANRDRSYVTAAIYDELERYVDHGILPSHFMSMVLQNRLLEASNTADPVNCALLGWIARFANRSTPSRARGDDKRIREWCEHKGLSGLAEDDRVYWGSGPI